MKFKGFTLVEVMVTAVITSLVLLGMSTALIVGSRTAQNTIMNSMLSTNGNRIVNHMVDDILVNADMKVENISMDRSSAVVGEKFIIKNRDDQDAIVYKIYYNTADDAKKNKVYRAVNGGADQEMVLINPTGQTIELIPPTTGTGYVFNSGNGYQADIVLTLVCKQGDQEIGRKVIKTAGITCRNFKKA